MGSGGPEGGQWGLWGVQAEAENCCRMVKRDSCSPAYTQWEPGPEEVTSGLPFRPEDQVTQAEGGGVLWV